MTYGLCLGRMLRSLYYFDLNLIVIFLIAVQAADPRFCAAGTKDLTKCNSWSMAMKSTVNFTCVSGKDEADCYMKIANKEADIGMFNGGEIYAAGKK